MLVELSAEQRAVLLRLIDAEIRELGPEIHHTRTDKDPLKEQRRFLRELRAQLSAGMGPPPTGASCESPPSEPR